MSVQRLSALFPLGKIVQFLVEFQMSCLACLPRVPVQ